MTSPNLSHSPTGHRKLAGRREPTIALQVSTPCRLMGPVTARIPERNTGDFHILCHFSLSHSQRKRYVEFCHQQTGGTQQGWWNEYYGENNDFWAKKQRDGEQYWTYGSFVVNSSVIIFTPKLCALLPLKQNARFYYGCFSLCFLVFDKFYYPL